VFGLGGLWLHHFRKMNAKGEVEIKAAVAVSSAKKTTPTFLFVCTEALLRRGPLGLTGVNTKRGRASDSQRVCG
jgi:hypothetical protein